MRQFFTGQYRIKVTRLPLLVHDQFEVRVTHQRRMLLVQGLNFVGVEPLRQHQVSEYGLPLSFRLMVPRYAWSIGCDLAPFWHSIDREVLVLFGIGVEACICERHRQ